MNVGQEFLVLPPKAAEESIGVWEYGSVCGHRNFVTRIRITPWREMAGGSALCTESITGMSRRREKFLTIAGDYRYASSDIEMNGAADFFKSDGELVLDGLF